MRVLRFELLLSLCEKSVSCLGRFLICSVEDCLIKDAWFFGQLLSAELEEGYSSAWIRLMYQSLSSLGFLRNLP